MSLALAVVALAGVIFVAALLVSSRAAWEHGPRWLWPAVMIAMALVLVALFASILTAHLMS